METTLALEGRWDKSCRQLGLIPILDKCLLHRVESNSIEKNINL